MALIDAINTATKADLDACVERLSEIDKERATLMAVVKILQARFAATPAAVKAPLKLLVTDEKPAVATSTMSANSSLRERRIRVALFIAKHGPRSKDKISEETKIAKVGAMCLGTVLDCDWFFINADDVVSLTGPGDNAARLANNSR